MSRAIRCDVCGVLHEEALGLSVLTITGGRGPDAVDGEMHICSSPCASAQELGEAMGRVWWFRDLRECGGRGVAGISEPTWEMRVLTRVRAVVEGWRATDPRGNNAQLVMLEEALGR